jgi:hypothetical protein
MLASITMSGRHVCTTRFDIQIDCACAGQQQGRGADGPDYGCKLHDRDSGAGMYVFPVGGRMMRSGSSTGPDVVLRSAAKNSNDCASTPEYGDKAGGEGPRDRAAVDVGYQ